MVLLTDEQLDIIEDLCRLRNDVYNVGADVFLNFQSSDRFHLSKAVCGLQSELSKFGLNEMNEFVGNLIGDNWPDDNDWFWILTEEEKEEWERKAEIKNNENENSDMKILI